MSTRDADGAARRDEDPAAAYVEYNDRHFEKGGADSTAPVSAGEAAARLRAYRPAGWKRVAAWGAVVMGAIMLVGGGGVSGEYPQTEAVNSWIASIFYFLVFAVPGAYWLWCNRRDTRQVAEWARRRDTYTEDWALLTADEQELFARPDSELPLVEKRRWGIVAVVVVVLLVLASLFIPDAAGVV